MPSKHLLITGKVQGVFYRASAKEKAEELAITGWVKNTAGGDVEAIITGEEPALQQFITWCRKGPSAAKVVDVQVTDLEEKIFSNFVIAR